MPMMANALDKATLIRSMSYTPNGQGIDPDTIVLNHLNQPRELVKGKVGGVVG